ncbi:hypothetical protein P171DRAFT_431353 [Karstenula rhodostoma CBS 690.94]|uniref:Uncharacterized protein n=1 Tax=Karstenula rhodostoma CBS 690.94 TaxID=1392251 RepID=A0A9P4PL22_9PLEO|nr:hypothetical protein P171DRAFT_431353 [Karstenula rhodostoma CBS 690.94]
MARVIVRTSQWRDVSLCSGSPWSMHCAGSGCTVSPGADFKADSQSSSCKRGGELLPPYAHSIRKLPAHHALARLPTVAIPSPHSLPLLHPRQPVNPRRNQTLPSPPYTESTSPHGISTPSARRLARVHVP